MDLRPILPIVGLAALMLPGCYSEPEAFAVASAKQSCKRLKRCNRSAFVDNHNDDMSECRADTEEALLDLVDILEVTGWEYDRNDGQECVSAQRSLKRDCSDDADEDIRNACEDLLLDGF